MVAPAPVEKLRPEPAQNRPNRPRMTQTCGNATMSAKMSHAMCRPGVAAALNEDPRPSPDGPAKQPFTPLPEPGPPMPDPEGSGSPG